MALYLSVICYCHCHVFSLMLASIQLAGSTKIRRVNMLNKVFNCKWLSGKVEYIGELQMGVIISSVMNFT